MCLGPVVRVAPHCEQTDMIPGLLPLQLQGEASDLGLHLTLAVTTCSLCHQGHLGLSQFLLPDGGEPFEDKKR